MVTADTLAVDHLTFASGVARRFARQIPWADRDELESDAQLGLLMAARQFQQQCPFERFAFGFIQSAIVDGLRRRTRWHRTDDAAIHVRREQVEISPAELAEIRDEVQAIRAGISEARYRRARSRRFSTSALSEEFRISRVAAARRIRRARRIICEEFSACHPSEN